MQYQKILIFLLVLTTQINGGGLYKTFYPLAEEIVSHMSLEQKLGQTVQSDFDQLNKRYNTTDFEQIQEYSLGSLLVGGNGCPDGKGNVKVQDDYSHATMEEWLMITKKCQEQKIVVGTLEGDIKIKLLLGTDAVHGNQHVLGEILFPHNIALASTHDPQNFANAANWNQQSIRKSGFNFAFAPTVAVSHNPQWGRFYETMGENPQEIFGFAKAYVEAVQDVQGGYIKGVLASTKHFLGDGATFNGNDEGNNKVYNFTKFFETNLAGYKGAIEANTGNIMVSYTAINDIAMTINPILLSGMLKEEMGFDGFLITDYDAVGKASNQGRPTTGVKMEFKQAYLMAINAGMDMMMQFPGDDEVVKNYFQMVRELLRSGDLRQSRVDDAVKKILAVKLAMQLIQVPESMAQRYGYKNPVEETQKPIDKDQEYKDALKAAQESFILLKNSRDVIPLQKDKLKYIILVGERGINSQGFQTLFQSFDNIGMQNGGWSVRWQGYEGNIFWKDDLKIQTRASSILDGILIELGTNEKIQILRPTYKSNTDWEVILDTRQKFLESLKNINDITNQNTVVIGAIGESPYAEFMGDINNKYCKGITKYVEGCIYNVHINEYMPLLQKDHLQVEYDQFSNDVITLLKTKANVPVITILFSGRPMIIDRPLDQSETFIAAWQPGTTGGVALTNALFGKYQFRYRDQVNTLPIHWISSMESLQDFPIYDGPNQPIIKEFLFERGYGLTSKKV